MIIQLGESHDIWLQVTDNGGNKIVDDTPYATIQCIESEAYWNGIGWSDEAKLYMESRKDGTYYYNWVPDGVGVFKVEAISEKYGIKESTLLEVKDPSESLFDWPIGEEYVVSADFEMSKVRPSITIEHDDMYWDGKDFIPVPIDIPMDIKKGTEAGKWLAVYSYTPLEPGSHIIKTSINGETAVVGLSAKEGVEASKPVIVSNKTIKGADGKGSEILGPDLRPMAGVSVKIYSKSTRELTAATASDTNGHWNTFVKPGTYIFMFEKSGYVTVTIERSVTE